MGLHETNSAGARPGLETGDWPWSPGTGVRYYGAANPRLDQALLLALRESAKLGSTCLALTPSGVSEHGFEWQRHAEFERRLGVRPFDDQERLLAGSFRAGV